MERHSLGLALSVLAPNSSRAAAVQPTGATLHRVSTILAVVTILTTASITQLVGVDCELWSWLVIQSARSAAMRCRQTLTTSFRCVTAVQSGTSTISRAHAVPATPRKRSVKSRLGALVTRSQLQDRDRGAALAQDHRAAVAERQGLELGAAAEEIRE